MGCQGEGEPGGVFEEVWGHGGFVDAGSGNGRVAGGGVWEDETDFDGWGEGEHFCVCGEEVVQRKRK